MPQIIPKAWKSAGTNGMLSGASPVVWMPPHADVGGGLSFGDGCKSGGGGEGHPSVEMLALLWRRLAAVSPGSLVKFEGWPLLPVITAQGRALAPLGAPVVMPDGLSMEVVNALRRAGVFVLDIASPAAVAAGKHPAIKAHVLPASGAGLLVWSCRLTVSKPIFKAYTVSEL